MPSVLIVDDDDAMRGMVALWLQTAGYEVQTAPNGRAALASLDQHAPCVIVLDLMMPVMSGWQFREAQLQRDEVAQIPVIVLSGHHNAQSEAQTLGAAAWVGKPIDVDRLINTVRHFCLPAAAV
jgi:CheY-like chemotaxis protein